MIGDVASADMGASQTSIATRAADFSAVAVQRRMPELSWGEIGRWSPCQFDLEYGWFILFACFFQKSFIAGTAIDAVAELFYESHFRAQLVSCRSRGRSD